METDRLYWVDQRCRKFGARVLEQRDDGIVLDRTAFYPTGGGQPNDTGALVSTGSEWTVTDVQQRDEIVHRTEAAGPEPGTSITGLLDWDRRWGLMRHHTAQHLLSAIMLEDFSAPTAGNQVYTNRARLDCDSDRLDRTDLDEIEDRLNAFVDADHSVRTYTLSRDRAEQELDSERTRLDLLPASVDPVRIVEIEGVDRTACGGTHVERTGEIGCIEVAGRETGGRGRERVRFRIVEEQG